jgi:hypothetical protein
MAAVARAVDPRHSKPQARIDRPVDKLRASHPLPLPRFLPKGASRVRFHAGRSLSVALAHWRPVKTAARLRPPSCSLLSVAANNARTKTRNSLTTEDLREMGVVSVGHRRPRGAFGRWPMNPCPYERQLSDLEVPAPMAVPARDIAVQHQVKANLTLIFQGKPWSVRGSPRFRSPASSPARVSFRPRPRSRLQ